MEPFVGDRAKRSACDIQCLCLILTDKNIIPSGISAESHRFNFCLRWQNKEAWIRRSCNYKVRPCDMKSCAFLLQATPTGTLFFQLSQTANRCSLAHDQPFHWILCKSVNPFGGYAPFCNRPLPLPRPPLAYWHKQTHTLDLHAIFQPFNAKEWGVFVDRQTDWLPDRQSEL